MKYIKTFESIQTEDYIEIDRTIYEKNLIDIKVLPMSNTYDIAVCMKDWKLKIGYFDYLGYLDDSEINKHDYKEDEKISYLIFSEKIDKNTEKYITIYKLDDEWYLVSKRTIRRNHKTFKTFYYKCDQFEGLMKLLPTIN